jgi:hypothetical protein
VVLAEDIAGGPDAVTVTLSGPFGALIEVYLHEYAGFAASNAFDVSTFNSGLATAAIDGIQSGPLTTTSDNELLFGFTVTGSAEAGTGFTPRSRFHGNLTEDKLLGTRGTYEATATMVGGKGWSMTATTFRGP